MKKNIKKIIAIGLISSSICMLPLTGASAEVKWRYDGANGWFYTRDDGQYTTGWLQDKGNWYYIGTDGFMKTGWIQDNGKWYYLNTDGSMATNTNVGGYQIDNNGAWIQNTTTNNVANTNSNNTTNINNGVINNGNINNGQVVNNNVTNNIYVNGSTPTVTTPTGASATPNTNQTINDDKVSFSNKNGWIKIDNDHYKYYENGQVLINTWKKFDEGYRHFNKEGYMNFGTTVDGLKIDDTGIFPLTNKTNDLKKTIFLEINPTDNYYGRNGDLTYITKTYDVFGIDYKLEYTDVYDSTEDGKIIGIKEKYSDKNNRWDDMNDDNFGAKKIIEIGKYTSRITID